MRFVSSFLSVAMIGLGALTACNSADWKDARTTAVNPASTPAPDGARRVTIPELKDMLDRNEAVAIDVRTEAAYNLAHIKGAKLIPEAEVVKRMDELPKNKLIVTYCS